VTRRRKRSEAIRLTWSPALAELFRLARPFADWTPPSHARLTVGAQRQTLSARFVSPEGEVMTARIRLRRDPRTGERDVVGEELSILLGRVTGGRE
jgi:hypothetical protein